MTTVNIATYALRKDVLPKTILSLREQTVPVHIRVFHNDYKPTPGDYEQHYNGLDYTDRGKFIWLDNDILNEDYGIYLCCDDDLYYPPDYIERTLEALKRYPKHIVTYHGRRLTGKDKSYYKGHEVYGFMNDLDEDTPVDIPGTGVCAFNTKYVQPDIIQYPEQKMADVLLGLEAAKKDIPIMCLAHKSNWIRSFPVPESIYHTEQKNSRQMEICNEVLDTKQQKQ